MEARVSADGFGEAWPTVSCGRPAHRCCWYGLRGVIPEFKEEDLLFRDLEKKDPSPKDRRVAEERVAEHVFGRKTTREAVEANNRYRHGDLTALTVIKAKRRFFADFYPKHIEKEDKVFFPACRTYFPGVEE